MINDTLEKIKARINHSAAVPEERKQELLNLVSTLEAEINELSKTRGEDAQSIAAFTDVSTLEATRSQQNPELLKHSLGGLSSSVEGLEKSHPRLVNIVNSICSTLSNLGI